MLDYKLLEAFYFVIHDGGFEKAASTLCLTQSAVSQRVKQLEEQAGQVLIIRSSPPKTTESGKLFLHHYLNVANLENNLKLKDSSSREIIKIGINADSLATWFMPLIQNLLGDNKLLELKVDNEAKTIDYLKNGEVIAAISTWDKPIQGCSIKKLGSIRYRLLSTPAFKLKFFPDGLKLNRLEDAPAVIFDQNDSLHADHLKSITGTVPYYPRHNIPSTEQFFNFVLSGHAYGMIPDIQSKICIKNNSLVDLSPDYFQDVELYLHRWAYISESAKEFLDNITLPN